MWSAIKYIYITAVLGACTVLHELRLYLSRSSMVNFSYVVLSIFVPCVYP